MTRGLKPNMRRRLCEAETREKKKMPCCRTVAYMQVVYRDLRM